VKTILTALRVTFFTLILTGLLYPLLVTGIAQLLFRRAAQGSLVVDDRGVAVGSELIAQPFAQAAYFHPRPSAAGNGYDATASGGSNLAVTSAKLQSDKRQLAADYRRENGLGERESIPADAIARSGSGLDPHITPDNALKQAARVARARRVLPGRVRTLVEANVEGRDLGFLGEPRINVLLLNLALDRQFGAPLR